MRFLFSLFAGKMYHFIHHKFYKSDRCGMLSLKLYDNFLGKISKPKIVIAVTGTNGKTTTNNLLCDVLENLGYKVACNKEGYNVRPGVSRALMTKTTFFNKTLADIAVIEVDELSLDVILPYIKANYLIVSNLSRDTLLRNGHTEYVFNQMEKGIPPYTKLVLNAEDLISSRLMCNADNEKIFYSIKRQGFETDEFNTRLQDIKICPNCHEELVYDFVRYHHIGFAHCPKCDFKNNEPNYQISKINTDENTFTLDGKEYSCVKGSGIFNVYNVLSIVAVLRDMGISEEDIIKSLKSLNIVETRFNELNIKGKNIVTTFLKGDNALSASRSFDFASKVGPKTNIVLVIDDQHEKVEHGMYEYMCFMYDSDYELLNNKNIDRIIIGGVHSYDEKVRMLMAGIPEEKLFLCDNELDCNKYIDYDNAENIVILHDLYAIDIMRKLVDNIKEDLK